MDVWLGPGGLLSTAEQAELGWWVLVLLGSLWATLRCGRAVLGAAATRREGPEAFVKRAESGSAMADYVLTLPIFTMLLLIVIQVGLLIHARLVVAQAAWRAARSVVVWLPAADASENERRRHAERAAALGCLSIGRARRPGLFEVVLEDGASDRYAWSLVEAAPAASYFGRMSEERKFVGPAFEPAVRRAHRFFAFGGSAAAPLEAPSERREARARRKYAHARTFTSVEIGGAGWDEQQGAGALTATVHHRYYLSVPWARAIFDERSFLDRFSGGAPHLTISDSHTLVNQGRVKGRGCR